MSHVFGPVPSRRLGLSLGVDLIPAKSCTYDCLYCQVGRTTGKTSETNSFVAIEEVLLEVRQKLEKITPDTITFSGSGEPTLHSRIGEVIAFIKGLTDIRTAILTNGSLLWREEVRKRVLGAHIIIPTLSTVFDRTFKAMHRPYPGLDLSMIIEGLKSLRKIYKGHLFLEVVLLAGFNDSNEEIEGLKKVIEEISPDKIQLNTVVRPPADSRALSLDRKRMEDIKSFFGVKAEIIADMAPKQKQQQYDSLSEAILEMAKRRPVRALDVANVLNISLEEVKELIDGLRMKGTLYGQEHSGEIYYKRSE